ncbi:MAG: hypothetical protein IJ617_07650 [Oscillospiraceae bacterium]|nr:hypothetical protein [Oscillospiraceae bacterium]
MFNKLFSQIFKYFGVFFRTIKAFVFRQFRSITARIRQLRNLPRHAAQAALSTVQTAANVTQKPSKREDYIEIGKLLISKSFLLRLVMGIVAVGALIWFVVWPFVLSHFLTARFYQEDRRVKDWSGRVIVYSDKKKTLPLYAGRLEEGVLQGQGERYDENGILIYEGTFQNGVYSGTGREYKDGILTYTGQFAEGVYEGSGTSYDNGMLLYSGQFSAGVYEGRGTLYKDGLKSYEGNFRAGVAAGDGAAYVNDVLRYQGQFAGGVPSGTGKEYGPDGALTYEGEFSAGVYNGHGIAYPSQGNQLEAAFSDGAPDGTVRWSKNGALYYEGEWQGSAPAGFGKLYNRAGETLYQGQFSGGTLDGAWLLGLTADGLRQALGTERTTSYQENAQSFFIASPELGVVGRCNYRTEQAESEVYSIYISPPASGWIRLLPGEDNIAVPEWPEDVARNVGPLQFNTPEGVNVPQGVYHSVMIFEPDKDLRTTLLYQSEGQKIASVLTWSRLSALPAAETESAAATESEKFGEFLEALDGMEKAAGAGLPTENPYYGEGELSPVLAECETPEQAGALVDALVEYWRLSETQKGLEENLERVEAMLSDAKAAVSMDSGSEALIESLTSEKLALEGRILNAQSGRKQAELVAGTYGAEPASLAVDTMLLIFDANTLDLDRLSLTAAAWAQLNGSTVRADELELELKSLLVYLANAYSTANNARSQYEAASQTAQKAATGYTMGTVDKAAWFRALMAQTDAQLALYDALASFTKYANALNQKTGGWVSRDNDWYLEELGFPVEPPEQTEESPEEEAGGKTAEPSEAATEADTVPAAPAEGTPEAGEKTDEPYDKVSEGEGA